MPPPPPPPPAAPAPVIAAPPKLDKNAAKGRNAMLNDISNFKANKLKKTVTNDRSAPAVAGKYQFERNVYCMNCFIF